MFRWKAEGALAQFSEQSEPQQQAAEEEQKQGLPSHVTQQQLHAQQGEEEALGKQEEAVKQGLHASLEGQQHTAQPALHQQTAEEEQQQPGQQQRDESAGQHLLAPPQLHQQLLAKQQQLMAADAERRQADEGQAQAVEQEQGPLAGNLQCCPAEGKQHELQPAGEDKPSQPAVQVQLQQSDPALARGLQETQSEQQQQAELREDCGQELHETAAAQCTHRYTEVGLISVC